MASTFASGRLLPARPLAALAGSVSSTLAAFALITPAVAQADVKTAVSPPTGVQATLNGTQVNFAPTAETSSTFLRSVQGRRVAVACVAGVKALSELVITSQGDEPPLGFFDVSTVGGFVDWPAGASSLSVTLPRDVSATADGCAVGRDLLATFGFSAEANQLLAEETPALSLRLAYGAAKATARARKNESFPAADKLAAAIAKSEPQLKVAVAGQVRKARRNGVVYVIASETNKQAVKLTYRRGGGLPTVLDGRPRGHANVQTPEDRDMPVPGGDVVRGGAGQRLG